MRHLFLLSVFGVIFLTGCKRHGGNNFLFDMGNDEQSLMPQYVCVTPVMYYSPEKGFGWLYAPGGSFDTANLKLYSPMFRKGVWGKDSLVFRVDLPDGDYFMIVSLGSKDSIDLRMTVSVNHLILPDTILSPQYRVPYHTYRKRISVHGNKAIVSIMGQGTAVAMYGLEFRRVSRYQSIDFNTALGTDTTVVKHFSEVLQQKIYEDKFNVSLINQLDIVNKYLLACNYFDGGGWSWAVKQTGLSLMYRMNAAADLLEQVVADPDDPLYNRALYLLARIYYWLDKEDDNKRQHERAQMLFLQLRQQYPEDSIIKMYSGENVTDLCNIGPVPPGAPQWAVYQREIMYRQLKIIHWWVTQQQADNGELGGKYGDDVEILRWWLPAILGVDDSIACAGYTRLADGVWKSDQLENGFARHIDDVEHAAELFTDTHPVMFLIKYGDPGYIERSMISMQHFRDVWTGITPLGHRHFRSYYLSASAVLSGHPYNVDVAMNARALRPGLWLSWYNRNPAIMQLLTAWGRAWIADADRTTNGKPAGILPSAVGFDNDQPGGHSSQWYNPGLTYSYYNWEHIGHVNELQYLLVGMYAISGQKIFLKPVNFYATLMMQALQEKVAEGTQIPGSLGWVKQQLLSGGEDHAPGVNPMGKLFAMARQLTHSSLYDTLVKKYGQYYPRYVLTQNKDEIVQGLEKTLTGLRYNLPLFTSEVKFTDRVYMQNSSLLSGMYTGYSGEGYEYPGLLVSWKNTGKDVAILVHGGDQQNIYASVFNFGVEKTVNMRTWQLSPGIYRIRTGIDRNGDERIDKLLTDETFIVTERVKDIPVKLPSAQLLVISAEQTVAYNNNRDEAKADLALSGEDILVKKIPGTELYDIQGCIHNVGNHRAVNSKVMLYIDNRAEDSISLALLDAPDNLQPQMKKVSFLWKPFTGKHSVRLRVDNDQPEITHLNNEASINFSVSSVKK